VPSAASASSLRVVDLEDIGPHYARTLALWRENLFAHADALRARGYPDALLRMFDFYLSYCEGGFAERALGDVQFVLQDARRAVAPTPRV
jgi:cyclopropane-fatty-acyl-phospholipid synthase